MIQHPLFPLPSLAGETYRFGQLAGSSASLLVANIVQQHCGPIILITASIQQAYHISQEIKQFSLQYINTLPDWETLPYDSFSPHKDIISSRLQQLYQLPMMDKGLFVLPVNTLMQKVMPKNFLMGYTFLMRKGQQFNRDTLRLTLEQAGYRAVDQVMEHGEFAIRGALFDLFPMGSQTPYRLDFFDDEIDSIRTFDIDSQRTLGEIEQIHLLPAHEFPTDKAAIERFRRHWREQFDIRRESEHLYQQVSKFQLPAGIEYWQPLFFDEPLLPLFTYLPENTLILTLGEINQAADRFWQDIKQRYESRNVDPMRPFLPPSALWLAPDELTCALKQWPCVKLQPSPLKDKIHHVNFNFLPLPDLSVDHKQSPPLKKLCQFVESFTGTLIFSAESEGRAQALLELLQRAHYYPILIKQLADITTPGLYMMVGTVTQGFIDEKNNQALITEQDLLGERLQVRRHDAQRTINTDTLIRNLAELQENQPVVHLEHGIGRYLGLITLQTAGIDGEYLVIRYADDAKLYVPVSSLYLISRYSGRSDEQAPLHKLGNDSWGKARQKAAEKVRDIAAELLDIYAQREAKPGFAFTQDSEQYQLFNESFPYYPTDDQLNAINAVLSDMCQAKAMDRLVCGDVGFGKTEVAMRAAFLSAINNKQVAILVPTTLLAQQHYENFRDRFANWPINIEVLSRFRTAKEQKQVLQAVTEGKVDILIGTHKLLQSHFRWHNLGLLIVDEEHRFGVRQKEQIKAMRANVDILTLTATPIPRTLNMAMSGMRDLSIIATPPARRLAIKTFVREYDPLVIREAILREILRGGQVYYLYNDVASIEKVADALRERVPEANIAVAHGQMNERELEHVMNNFQHQRFNVLVCTTIIETGIDIPNANTIIIERADRFGLAQLHQLRGRVGRSHHQAYAYLLTPPPKAMTKEAQQRLHAIASLEDLGAGFALATHDLEIRGAGELLGEEQSGQIAAVGFSLYMEFLDHAVKALQSGKEPSLEDLMVNQVEIDLHLPMLLSENYMPEVNTRLSFYKRIASATTANELHELKIELIDRFGLLPEVTKNLLQIAEFRLLSQQLGIKRINAGNQGGFIEFTEQHKIDQGFLIGLLQQPSQYHLDGSTRLRFTESLPDPMSRLTFIHQLLQAFALHSHHDESSV